MKTNSSKRGKLPSIVVAAALAYLGLIFTGQAQVLTMDQIKSNLLSNPPGFGDPALREASLRAFDALLLPNASPAAIQFYRDQVGKVAQELQADVPVGARVWMMYNHGFIVKTPGAVFAFDLRSRPGSAVVTLPDDLVKRIDVLFVSHEHSDHYDSSLANRVRANNGWVVGPSEMFTTVGRVVGMAAGQTLAIGNLQVTAHYGEHSVPVRMFEVTCPNGLKVLHTGDNQHSRNLPTVKGCVLLLNAWVNESGSTSAAVGMRNSLARVQPTVMIPGHIQELGHSYSPGNPASRVIYAWAFEVDDEPTAAPMLVMTWGEGYVMDPLITSQPVSQNREISESVTFSVTAVGTEPLGYQWRRDGVPVAGAAVASLTLTNLQAAHAGSYTVVVSNQYGSVTSLKALLTVNAATVDSGFNPGAGGRVRSLALQPDGMLLVGGDFATLAGRARNRIGRLHPNGTLDLLFNPGAAGNVFSLALQSDGKILVGCYAGSATGNLKRLHADGSLDTPFNPLLTGSGLESLAVQADGKIVVVGSFIRLGGQTRNNIGRLNNDGTLDAGFDPGANSSLFCLALQPDGKILVGGSFTSLGGQNRSYLARLNANGTVDASFNPEASYWVNCLAVQADDKILVGGSFTTLGGQPRNKIARLNPDGTLDMSFNPGVSASISLIWSLVVQTDGKILVCGSFTSLGGQLRNYIARLNIDGTLDPTFNPRVTASGTYAMCSLVLQPDGRILVGGDFTALGGQPRSRIGRLNNTEPATQSLSCDGSEVTWLRCGTSPEVWRTTLEASTNSGTNGTVWSTLSTGRRVLGGWRFGGLSVAANANIRARGFLAAGYDNGSSWFVETNFIASAPAILTQPVSRTNNVGTEALFTVVAGGTPTLNFQWRKDGTNLVGATRSSLSLTNIQEVDQGFYLAVVSNSFGLAVSSNALLVVNQAPVADASATQPTVISANGADAPVILNGAGSSDPDGDLLQYAWYEAGNSNPLACGAVAVAVLPVGAHSLLLVVNDGMLEATRAFAVEVITTIQAVERLMAQVDSRLSRSRPLLATLEAARASIERGNAVAAINQLQAFQNKVRAQVAPPDPALAATFSHAAQEIIDVMGDGGTNPGGQPHGRFAKVERQPSGRVHIEFSAQPGPVYILEASTNLVDWEMIGVAVDHGDDTFTFDDPNAARFPNRFYRIVSLSK